jgi:hypothetical protein
MDRFRYLHDGIDKSLAPLQLVGNYYIQHRWLYLRCIESSSFGNERTVKKVSFKFEERCNISMFGCLQTLHG